MLNEVNSLPDGFLDAGADELLDCLGKPSLIHLPGENPRPLFICTLLHGNETTGLHALQRLLKNWRDRPLPRALSIFIGNVEAAAQNRRRLDGQKDFNRIWPGTPHDDCEETDLAQLVTRIMRKRKPFASIDIHNNTGNNPHYACVNILNPHCLQLAALFSPQAVYFTSPRGVQSAAFSDFCPAVVLECGQSGQEDGIAHARRYLEKVMQLQSLPSGQPGNLNIYHTVARVLVPPNVRIGHGEELDLPADLEQRNFSVLQEGAEFARCQCRQKSAFRAPLIVQDESNEDVSDDYFDYEEQIIRLKRPVVLAMYTTSEAAIRQDCLCYFMERLSLQV